ncbi:hypothetical protein GCM10007301_09410 [Azorhizobium oxalatiphilum]|uniref:Uncharacterized protein n=1 Tax=Azorhizobium oxalatiphilum TaxID=980631 RepID=A0A917F6A5_9HYPH|nr:hypothetical protein [Azorhizobium oxalatiphilum]GGF52060.1 hypothetical protein GCM10007301_09410 [Azorhizobium oxalatiphilum]
MTAKLMRLISDLPASSRRVELCYNHAKTLCWLQLTNTEFIVDRRGPGFVAALIGAYATPAGWKTMDPETANLNRDVTLTFGDTICERVGLFQRAVARSWAGFSHATAHRYAKGLTFGRDLSSPSFVMQALRTGFEAIGLYVPAYKGTRNVGFSVDDAIAYLQARARNVPVPITDAALHEFVRVGPDPAGSVTEDHVIRSNPGDTRDIPAIRSNRMLNDDGKLAYVTEREGIKLERLIGYGFLGDTRPPNAIREAGGFNPDRVLGASIAAKSAKDREEAMTHHRLIEGQFAGGYVSLTKSVGLAKGYGIELNGLAGMTGPAGVAGRRSGWVYACFVEGGFNIAKTDQNRLSPASFNEQVLSMPGKLDWDDVVACRRVSRHGTFKGDLFIKRSFYLQDPDACIKVFELLSGRSQGAMPVKAPQPKQPPMTPSIFLKKMFQK